MSNIKKIYFSKQIKISCDEFTEGSIKYKNKNCETLIIELINYINLSKKSDYLLTKNCMILEKLYKKIKQYETEFINNNINYKKIKLIE